MHLCLDCEEFVEPQQATHYVPFGSSRAVRMPAEQLAHDCSPDRCPQCGGEDLWTMDEIRERLK